MEVHAFFPWSLSRMAHDNVPHATPYQYTQRYSHTSSPTPLPYRSASVLTVQPFAANTARLPLDTKYTFTHMTSTTPPIDPDNPPPGPSPTTPLPPPLPSPTPTAPAPSAGSPSIRSVGARYSPVNMLFSNPSRNVPGWSSLTQFSRSCKSWQGRWLWEGGRRRRRIA